MDVYLPKANGENFFQIFSTDIQSVAGWFSREYEMHLIDLKIQSIINSHEIIRLILGSGLCSGQRMLVAPMATTIIKLLKVLDNDKGGN
jgi:hypothetical protein